VTKHTPQLQTGEAEFFFIANDATIKVLEHLRTKKYKYHAHNNTRFTESELFKQGIGTPEYISRVYRGWNKAIELAKEIVVLLNSDNACSPNWLSNLIKHLTPNTIVCSQLVERSHPKHGVFPGAIHAECGNTPETYNERRFLSIVEQCSQLGIRQGGAFMPCCFMKEIIKKIGSYPEGNLHAGTFDRIRLYGDQDFFGRAAKAGIQHVTSADSVCYHFKEIGRAHV
jgi:hypothetical protein